jgi:hypothetical protein
MILPCLRCGKNDFKKSRDRVKHINRKFPCTLQIQPQPDQREEITREAEVTPVIELVPAVPEVKPEVKPEADPEVVSEVIPSTESPKITDEMIQKSICQQEWVNPNARRPKEHFCQWGV